MASDAHKGAPLPPLSHLDKVESIKKNDEYHQIRRSSAEKPFPSLAPSDPPPPYSYSAQNFPPAIPSNGQISPPESRRKSSAQESFEQTSQGSSKLRHTLPPISVALGGSEQSYHNPTSRSPRSGHSHPYSQHSPHEGPKYGPPEPHRREYENPPSAHRGPTGYGPPHSQPSYGPPPPTSRPSPVSSQRLNPSVGYSPPHHHAQRNASPPRQSYSQAARYEPRSYGEIHAPRYQPPAPRGYAQYQIGNGPPPPPPQSASWHRSDPQYDGDFKKPDRSRPLNYSESVKRHLDSFDYETSLNDIYESGHQICKFADIWRERAHHNPRDRPSLHQMPQIPDVDDMLRQSSRVQDSLRCLRDMIAMQHAEVEERSQKERERLHHESAMDEYSVAQEEQKAGGFAGNDTKKRRGRAAPPGRCHSCNRAETPEWRRGPDGARTLCNACGLHYAKLTRKMGPGKAPVGSSNLRPKSLDPTSPAT